VAAISNGRSMSKVHLVVIADYEDVKVVAGVTQEDINEAIKDQLLEALEFADEDNSFGALSRAQSDTMGKVAAWSDEKYKRLLRNALDRMPPIAVDREGRIESDARVRLVGWEGEVHGVREDALPWLGGHSMALTTSSL
jgi:hypothetical protein